MSEITSVYGEEPTQPVLWPQVTVRPNRAFDLYFEVQEKILEVLESPRAPVDPNPLARISVEQMYGIDPGAFVLVGKLHTANDGYPDRALVERARTVDVNVRLGDARQPEGEVLVSLHCYEHVYNGPHQIELVVPKHKYFEWLYDHDPVKNASRTEEITTMAVRYLCTGDYGAMPPTCKYPPPHIPQVR